MALVGAGNTTRQQNTHKQNVLLREVVIELTPSVPGLDNGARYPQCTYTKAARSHTDGVGLEIEKNNVESRHPSTLPFAMPWKERKGRCSDGRHIKEHTARAQFERKGKETKMATM